MNFELSLMIKAMEQVIEYLKSIGVNEISVVSDYYWDTGSTEKFDIEKKLEIDENGIIKIHKNELCIGSLCDDVMELTKDVNNVNAVSTVTIDRLAHILEYLTYYVHTQVFKSYTE